MSLGFSIRRYRARVFYLPRRRIEPFYMRLMTRSCMIHIIRCKYGCRYYTQRNIKNTNVHNIIENLQSDISDF